jgi:hypothetical protein
MNVETLRPPDSPTPTSPTTVSAFLTVGLWSWVKQA